MNNKKKDPFENYLCEIPPLHLMPFFIYKRAKKLVYCCNAGGAKKNPRHENLNINFRDGGLRRLRIFFQWILYTVLNMNYFAAFSQKARRTSSGRLTARLLLTKKLSPPMMMLNTISVANWLRVNFPNLQYCSRTDKNFIEDFRRAHQNIRAIMTAIIEKLYGT